MRLQRDVREGLGLGWYIESALFEVLALHSDGERVKYEDANPFVVLVQIRQALGESKYLPIGRFAPQRARDGVELAFSGDGHG